MERCLRNEAKSTCVAWNTLPSLTLAPGKPNDDSPGLSMAAHGGNISPKRRIIRCMSENHSSSPITTPFAEKFFRGHDNKGMSAAVHMR